MEDSQRRKPVADEQLEFDFMKKKPYQEIQNFSYFLDKLWTMVINDFRERNKNLGSQDPFERGPWTGF